MSDQLLLDEVVPAIARRQATRRGLLAKAAVAAGAWAGSGLFGRSRRQSADAAATGLRYGPKGRKIHVKDTDILNFALNLEYLEAEFYQRAAYGAVLGTADISGTGTQGEVTGGGQVSFTDPILQQYVEEIAEDELNHVRYLRSVLGKDAVARPSIDFTNGFNTAAVDATILTAAQVTAGSTFDPFSGGDTAFLLGAFLFEDVGVTAYQGAMPYIQSSTYLGKAAGILAIEGQHAAAIRTTLYQMAIANSDTSSLDAANDLSKARETLSQAADSIAPTDGMISNAAVTAPTIVPSNTYGFTYARSFSAVLNILYLGGYDVLAQAGAGGFFPNGFNGRIT